MHPCATLRTPQTLRHCVLKSLSVSLCLSPSELARSHEKIACALFSSLPLSMDCSRYRFLLIRVSSLLVTALLLHHLLLHSPWTPNRQWHFRTTKVTAPSETALLHLLCPSIPTRLLQDALLLVPPPLLPIPSSLPTNSIPPHATWSRLLLPSPPRKRVWQLASSQVLCTSMSILSVPGLRANICPSSVVSSIFFCHAPTHTPKRHTRTHTALVSLGFRV